MWSDFVLEPDMIRSIQILYFKESLEAFQINFKDANGKVLANTEYDFEPGARSHLQ